MDSCGRTPVILAAILFAAPAVVVAGGAGDESAAFNPPLISWKAPAAYSPPERGPRTKFVDLSGPLPYVPVTACRQYDSRSYSPLPNNTPRAVTLSGAPCGIPSQAQAVALNITIFNITGAASNGVFKAGDSSPPTSAWINYPLTETQRGNAGVVSVSAGAVLYVQVNQGAGSVDFTVDVFGYYTTSPANQGNTFQVTNSGNAPAIQATNLSTGCSGPCGVAATVSSGIAIYGTSATGSDGVYGTSSDASGSGVHGFLSQNFAGSRAVFGEHAGTGGGISGVYGSVNTTATGNYGVYSLGNMGASGTKPFVEPHPTDPTKVIRYVALEGPEAGTYFRGRAFVHKGTVEIEVPESFRIVTDEEGLTVHVTPMGRAQVWVERADLNEIVLGASRDVLVSYIVHGVRRAFKEWQPVGEGAEYMPASPDARSPEGLSDEARRRLIANGTYNADGTVNMATAERVGWTAIWESRGAHLRASPGPAPSEIRSPRR